MAIRIRLIRSTGVTARLIQLGMHLWSIIRLKRFKKCYNHCEVGYGEFTSGALQEGAKTRKWSTYKKEHPHIKVVEYKINLSHKEWVKAKVYLDSVEGTPYEFENFWFHTLKIFTGKWFGSRKDKKLYCYEHGIRFLNASGKYLISPFLNPYEFKEWADKNLK